MYNHMADVVVLEANKNQYLKSVNTTDYTESDSVLINPDISAVENVPIKFWKKGDKNNVIEMTLEEKNNISSFELQERKNAVDKFNINLETLFEVFIKIVNTRLPVGQKITKKEFIDALKMEIT